MISDGRLLCLYCNILKSSLTINIVYMDPAMAYLCCLDYAIFVQCCNFLNNRAVLYNCRQDRKSNMTTNLPKDTS